MEKSTEHRLTDLEARMAATEKLNAETAKVVNDTAIIQAKQTVQMEIVWGIMKIGGSAVLLALLGLVLSAAIGKPVHVGAP